MKRVMEKLEQLLELGGIKKDILFLALSGAAVLCSLLKIAPFSFDLAWVAVVLCGIPIILEAVIGLVTAFDIKADVLVSLALIASVCIGQDFAAGEVAFIMQLGGLLEELTVAKARAGIEKLVHLTPRTARLVRDGTETVIPAIMAAIGNATKHGFLVREGDALERLAGVKVVAFDKTGTLTYGTPEVVAAVSVLPELPQETLYRLAASAEQLSEHPLGKAIVRGCKKSGAVIAVVAAILLFV